MLMDRALSSKSDRTSKRDSELARLSTYGAQEASATNANIKCDVGNLLV